MHGIIYKKIMSSRRWRQLRAAKLAANPFCEMHLKQGMQVKATCIHHIKEVESGLSEDECKKLAFSWDNLQSLCKDCHTKVHKERGTWTAKNHQDREKERLQQWATSLLRQ